MNPREFAKSRLVLPLDGMDMATAEAWARRWPGALGFLKLHSLFLHNHGALEALRKAGAPQLFLDLKFHDIPATVAGHVKAILPYKPQIITVHAQGGVEMMRAAVEAAGSDTKVLAITELTSSGSEDVREKTGRSAMDQVLFLARWAKMAGVWGVVCSPQEVGPLTSAPDLNGLVTFVPGVRLAGGDINDQKRVDTPMNAVKNGANYLVVGRPLTQAKDPDSALEAIVDDMVNGFDARCRALEAAKST